MAGFFTGPYDDDPTLAAAKGLYASESATAPFHMASADRSGTAGFGGSVPSPGLGAGTARMKGDVNPGDYGSDFIHGSDQWYGSLNQYGAQVAGASPEGFWAGYGTDVQGWQPGGSASAFMSSAFDPRAMGAAMYGNGKGSPGFTSVEEVLGGSTGIANALVGDSSHAQFVNPAAITGSIVQALSSGDIKDLANVNPILASIINNNTGNPIGQIDSLMTFLKDALRGSMPPDVLQAWLSTIQRLGAVFTSDMMHGDMKKMDVASFVGFLAQQLGPTLGL